MSKWRTLTIEFATDETIPERRGAPDVETLARLMRAVAALLEVEGPMYLSGVNLGDEKLHPGNPVVDPRLAPKPPRPCFEPAFHLKPDLELDAMQRDVDAYVRAVRDQRERRDRQAGMLLWGVHL